NIVLASDAAKLDLDPSRMHARFLERGVQDPLLSLGYLKLRLDDQWIEWFGRSTSGATRMVNSDAKPAAVYQALILWNKQFSGATTEVLRFFARIRLWMVLLAAAAGALALFLAGRKRPRLAPRMAVLYSISSTGFFGMAMNLALIFSFQAQYGYVYRMIGALTAVFMAGVAGGSVVMRFASRRYKKGWAAFFANEAAIVVFIVIAFVCINFFGRGANSTYLYMILCFITGGLLGSEFPLAVRLYGENDARAIRSTGVVFGADLVGGVAASVTAGVILLPLLGVGQLLIFLGFIKVFAAVNICLIKKMK
ncbi:MAG: hypothetical protein WCY10_06470, partial [Candidatus Omnitrophota bacterium]